MSLSLKFWPRQKKKKKKKRTGKIKNVQKINSNSDNLSNHVIFPLNQLALCKP